MIVEVGGLGIWLDGLPGAWLKERLGEDNLRLGSGLIGLVTKGLRGSELSSGMVSPWTPGAISLFGGLMYLTLTGLLLTTIGWLLLTNGLLLITVGFWEGACWFAGVSKGIIPSEEVLVDGLYEFS